MTGKKIGVPVLVCELSGVPNDSFEENPPYSVLNITRVSLRQFCLLFNFPGEKIPALHRQQAWF